MKTTGHVCPRRHLAMPFIVLVFGLLLFLEPANADTKDRIINVGKQYLGTPSGPGQLTCSEFTRVVYGRATGVWMPAWDDKQRFYGQKVRPKKRGDLVLFKEHGGAGAVTHVGIYYGRGQILHSSSYFGQVVVSDMQYINGYRGARRIR